MKLFLAVDLPEQTVQDVLEQTSQLRKDYPDFNWVPPENFHITLYYIGEVQDVKVPIVVEHVENMLYDIEETHVYSLGADLFINKQIVLYLSFQRNKTLELLNEKFRELFEDKSKKEYKHHLTIARYKIPSKQQYFHLKKKLQNVDVELDFPVNKIHLFQSIAQPKNPIYNKIKTFELQSKI